MRGRVSEQRAEAESTDIDPGIRAMSGFFVPLCHRGVVDKCVLIKAFELFHSAKICHINKASRIVWSTRLLLR